MDEHDNHVGWLQVLDDLEANLDSAARAMAVTENADTITVQRGIAWRAPDQLGQLPRELEERARDVLLNQKKLVHELEQARRSTRQHLTALRSVPAARDGRASVYLDVAG